jgi:hypothetical protein
MVNKINSCMTPSNYKRPQRRLALKHLKYIKSILIFADKYTQKYNFIFDESLSRSMWTTRVENKYKHLHTTLDLLMHRGDTTIQCDDQQKTLLLLSDMNMYLTEMIEFVECRIATTHQYIPISWRIDHDQLTKLAKWVNGVLHAVVPDNCVDITQGLTDEIHRVIN